MSPWMRAVGTSGPMPQPSKKYCTTGGQTVPAVAYDGTNFLVVWQDPREDGTQYDIYGARVSPAGTLLHQDLSLAERVLRDIASDTTQAIVPCAVRTPASSTSRAE